MRNLIVAAGALVAAMLIAVPVAAGATPQQIYRDFADNGHLDGTYSTADLQRALKDAVLQEYGGPSGQNLKPAIKKGVAKKNNQGQQSQSGQKGGETNASTPPVQSSSGLPFTGLDLAVVLIVGVLLLAFGVGLRRFARRTG